MLKIVLKEEIIKEIEDWEQSTISSYLPLPETIRKTGQFPQIFGNKLRLVMKAPNFVPDVLQDIMNEFSSSGKWSFDWSTRIATTLKKTVYQGKERTKKVELPITSLLTQTIEKFKKLAAAVMALIDSGDIGGGRPDESDEEWMRRKEKATEKAETERRKWVARVDELYDGPDVDWKTTTYRYQIDDLHSRLNRLLSLYNNDFSGLKLGPDGKMPSNNFIVISRHPWDIVRMSDFDGFSSCHAFQSSHEENVHGDYVKCAVHDASGYGAIAYLVEKDEFANLQQGKIDADEEIFADPSRNMKGLTPKERVRIRNIAYTPENQSIAVLEDKHYPSFKRAWPGFNDAVKGFLAKKQKDLVEKINARIDNGEALNLSDFMIMGGSYMDTSAEKFLKNAGLIYDNTVGHIRQDPRTGRREAEIAGDFSNDSEEEEFENLRETFYEYERIVNRAFRQYSYEWTNIKPHFDINELEDINSVPGGMIRATLDEQPLNPIVLPRTVNQEYLDHIGGWKFKQEVGKLVSRYLSRVIDNIESFEFSYSLDKVDAPNSAIAFQATLNMEFYTEIPYEIDQYSPNTFKKGIHEILNAFKIVDEWITDDDEWEKFDIFCGNIMFPNHNELMAMRNQLKQNKLMTTHDVDSYHPHLNQKDHGAYQPNLLERFRRFNFKGQNNALNFPKGAMLSNRDRKLYKI